MRIGAFALRGNRGWHDTSLDGLDAGLNVFHGPTAAGKTTLADFVAHVLYGRRLAPTASAEQNVAPEGELIVESRGSRFRLRRYQDDTSSDRLTVAALDGSAVDQHTVRQLVCGVSPTLLGQLFVASFREAPRLKTLLSEDFAREFRSAIGAVEGEYNGPHVHRLVANRDALAAELESHISGQRRHSHDLDAEWHALDREITDRTHELDQLQHRLVAVEAELAEIDAWLRYDQLGAAVEQRATAEPADWEARRNELDEQINRWRTVLAELDERKARVQVRIANDRPEDGEPAVVLADQRASLAVTRQLMSDLQGEVARLARASGSDACVCNYAHPRLRPIVDTLSRQLDVLDGLAAQTDRAMRSLDLRKEADHLARSQVEIQNQLEHLLDCRQTLSRGTRRGRFQQFWLAGKAAGTSEEELVGRRAGLVRERHDLQDRLAALIPRVPDLRAQLATVERDRANALSATAIDAKQRELATVQQELERATQGGTRIRDVSGGIDGATRASDFLAQLTDGELVRLQLAASGRGAHVVNRAGDSVSLESITPAERDQVFLSLCLALVAACGRQGIYLPLVLDEPFLRLDHRATAALAAVLDDFSRRGHQILVFTAHRDAADRFVALGAKLCEIATLQHPISIGERPLGVIPAAVADGVAPKRKRKRKIVPPPTDHGPHSTRHREAG